MATPVPDRAADAGDAHLYMDACRAVLALAVTFGHAWTLLIEDYRATASVAVRALYGLAGFAHAAVVMFFVLSGYWITRSVVGRAARGWSWRGHLLDRWSRLAVVLVPALLLGGLLDGAALWLLDSPTHWGETGSWVLRKDVAADLSPATLLGNLLFLQGIAVHAYGANGPLWSVAAEFWFYCWFPALFLLIRDRKPGWMLASFAILPFAPGYPLYFLQWLCGSALFFGERRGTPSASRASRRLALGASGAALGCALLWARTGAAAAEDLVLAAGFAGFLLVLVGARPRALPGVAALARFGARSSFSLYAIHFPVIAFVAALALGERRLPPDVVGVSLVGLAVLVAVAAGVAFSAMTEAHTGAVRARLDRRLGRVARA